MSIEARQRKNTSERGTAIVEAAVIVFFLLLFGVFEACRSIQIVADEPKVKQVSEF